MTPKIVFISACAGAGGHYVARILQILSRGWSPVIGDSYFSCHKATSHKNIINTIPSPPFADIETEIHKFCGLGEFSGTDLSAGQDFFRENFKYDDLGFPFHIVLAHVLNPMPFLGVRDSKIIRVNIDKSDAPQLSYNFVKKMIQTDLEHLKELSRDTVTKELKRVQNKGKLIGLNPTNINLDDDKLLTYIYWVCSKASFESFSNIILPNSSAVFNVNFSDLMNGAIKDQINDLAKFIHQDPDNKTLEACNQLIDLYTKQQKKIPWELNINDY